MTASRRIQLVIKRLIDIAVGLLVLVIAAPLMLVIALLVKCDGGPILFRQQRVGKDARLFKLNKFRTMVPDAIHQGAGLKTTADDPRITPVGRFLRRTSLDELPQLLNVITGDLSLVGPRPTVPSHLANYGEFERRRLTMCPGATGLAVVRGRNTYPWSVRIRHDVEYVERFSLLLDAWILMQTIRVILTGDGTYYDYDKYGPAFDLPLRQNDPQNRSSIKEGHDAE